MRSLVAICCHTSLQDQRSCKCCISKRGTWWDMDISVQTHKPQNQQQHQTRSLIQLKVVSQKKTFRSEFGVSLDAEIIQSSLIKFWMSELRTRFSASKEPVQWICWLPPMLQCPLKQLPGDKLKGRPHKSKWAQAQLMPLRFVSVPKKRSL